MADAGTQIRDWKHQATANALIDSADGARIRVPIFAFWLSRAYGMPTSYVQRRAGRPAMDASGPGPAGPILHVN